MAQSRSYFHTLSPNVGIIYILGAIGEDHISLRMLETMVPGLLCLGP